MTPTIKLSIDDIRMLAEQERNMDSGKVTFVKDKDGNRWAVSPEVMAELGFESKQTISGTLITAMLEASLASIQARIALDKAAKTTQGKTP